MIIKSFLSLCLLLAPALSMAKSKKDILKDFQDKKIIVLDVREFDEIKDGMIEGAIWIPFNELKSKKPTARVTEVMSKLDKNKEIQVYCAVGGRAGTVKNMLAAQGYKIDNLGGFKDLKDMGYPTVKIEKSAPEGCPWLCP